MKINENERLAILRVIEFGETYGYGNMIAHLNTAWARKLIKNGMEESVAMKSTHGKGYPVKMQDDLINNGEWDETGDRYK